MSQSPQAGEGAGGQTPARMADPRLRSVHKNARSQKAYLHTRYKLQTTDSAPSTASERSLPSQQCRLNRIRWFSLSPHHTISTPRWRLHATDNGGATAEAEPAASPAGGGGWSAAGATGEPEVCSSASPPISVPPIFPAVPPCVCGEKTQPGGEGQLSCAWSTPGKVANSPNN